MDITVNITRRDLFWMNFHVFLRMKEIWVFLLILWIGLIAYQIIRHGSPVSVPDILILLFASGLGVVGGAVSFVLYGTAWVIASSTRKAGVLGDHYFAIRDDGFFERTEANETLTRWPSIQSVWKTGPYILVRINAYLFHVIPKAAFESEAAFDAFHEAVVSKWRRDA